MIMNGPSTEAACASTATEMEQVSPSSVTAEDDGRQGDDDIIDGAQDSAEMGLTNGGHMAVVHLRRLRCILGHLSGCTHATRRGDAELASLCLEATALGT